MDKKLLEILACPKCKKKVTYNETSNQIQCSECQLTFPIKHNVPVMLLNEATPIRK